MFLVPGSWMLSQFHDTFRSSLLCCGVVCCACWLFSRMLMVLFVLYSYLKLFPYNFTTTLFGVDGMAFNVALNKFICNGRLILQVKVIFLSSFLLTLCICPRAALISGYLCRTYLLGTNFRVPWKTRALTFRPYKKRVRSILLNHHQI